MAPRPGRAAGQPRPLTVPVPLLAPSLPLLIPLPVLPALPPLVPLVKVRPFGVVPLPALPPVVVGGPLPEPLPAPSPLLVPEGPDGALLPLELSASPLLLAPVLPFPVPATLPVAVDVTPFPPVREASSAWLATVEASSRRDVGAGRAVRVDAAGALGLDLIV